ncbi:MAG TPA: hypothetical protein VF176_08245 [Solirubrobacterales bacterium]
MPKKTLIGILAIAALGAASIAQTATATTVRAGNLTIEVDANLSPTKLSKSAPTPIALTVSGSIKSNDGSHPAALRTLSLQFDRHGHIFTKGLPTCNPGKLQATLTSQAKKACSKALIGTGRVSAEIALNEQAPFNASGPLLIFNGPPKGGKPVLVFHVHANVPAPTTFVTSGVIGKGSGKYGTDTEIAIPTIVAGQGSLTSFDAKIPKKTWTYKNRKQSLLTASCPSGHLYAHGDFAFADGTRISGNVVKSCTPKG